MVMNQTMKMTKYQDTARAKKGSPDEAKEGQYRSQGETAES